MNSIEFCKKNKYYFLIIGLLQHLFIGIFLSDLDFYSRIIWPINMIILGLSSIGLFIDKGRTKNYIAFSLFIAVFLFPIMLPFFENSPVFIELLSIVYIIYFLSVFAEIMRFLIKPHYINVDIILASTCGYLLLIEIHTFLMFFLHYTDAGHLNNIDINNPPASIFMDLVYFSSIVKTSIGFGDITPNSYQAKLIISFFGVASQLYSVVLVGILISKFTARKS